MTEAEAPTIPAGLRIVSRRGQRFTCLGIISHIGGDGREQVFALWKTRCRVCDAPLEVRGWARLVDPNGLTKECPDHRMGKRGVAP